MATRGRSSRGGDRPPRAWSRLDRVNEALREVVAEELERIGDERLGLVTVTGIRVDPDLRKAVVWYSALTAPAGAAATEAPDVVLAEHRVRLQAAVGRQLRLKRTPEFHFEPDPAIAVGTRVEDILRGLNPPGADLRIDVIGEVTTERGTAPGSPPGPEGEPS